MFPLQPADVRRPAWLELFTSAQFTWALFTCCLAALACRHAPLAVAQEERVVDPRAFGLEIPPGVVEKAGDRRVLVEDSGGPVVARVHAVVGDWLVVRMPDGRLKGCAEGKAIETDKPFAPLSCAELGERMTETSLKGFHVKTTRRYVFLYNTSEEYALAASRILETMFKGVVLHAQAQKIEVHEPETPLTAIMFRTEEEFQRFQRMPPGVAAYYNVLTNQVVMHESPAVEGVSRELAIGQSISTIAHEGAHQILHNIGVQQRLSIWPMWLAEGLAEYFAPTSTGQRLHWKGAGQVNDLRMFELEQYLKGKSLDAEPGRMIADTVGAPRLTSTGYASAWALCHYLAKTHREAFHELLRQMSLLGPFEGACEVNASRLVDENLTVFREHFKEDLPELEEKLLVHLKRLPYRDPFAHAPHFVAAVAYSQGKQAMRAAASFHSRQRAEQWRSDLLSKLSPQERAAAVSEVRPFANRALAEEFASAWKAGR